MTVQAVSFLDVVGAKRATWVVMANGDSGDPVSFASLKDKTVQVTGTFGAGGTVLWEGSNDGTNYKTLNDVGGTALSWTAASLKGVLENPLWVRPRVSAGDGTTALVATLTAS